ncbi:MAG: dockerin type I domain-containing protein, partial [Bacillota bacterium]|nr:dockerin type I domain-containing protein [Bacillota bacterium]
SKISANGGVVTLGFNVSYSGANNKPSSIIINGSAATIIGVVTTPKPTTTITPTETKAPTATPTQIIGDINGDDTVNMADVVLIAGSFNLLQGDVGFNSKCDLNEDKCVNMSDVIIVAQNFGKTKA